MRNSALLLLSLQWMVSAQLTEKPETWTSFEGHYVREALPAEALYVNYLCRIAINEMALANLKKPEAASLLEITNRAMQAGNVNAASRFGDRLLAVLRGQTPGEWLELASSMQFSIDRRIAAPGTVIHPRLEPLFVIDRELKGKYSARISLLNTDSTPAAAPKTVAIESYEQREFSLPTARLPEGDYVVRYELLDAESKVLAAAGRPLLIDSKLRARTASLVTRTEKLVLAGVAQKSPRHAAAIHSLSYLAELYGRAFAEPVAGFHAGLSPSALHSMPAGAPVYSTEPLRPATDFAFAEALVSDLEAGGDPLSSRTGGLRLAFRASVDQTIQPYRLYVPKSYTPAKKAPLVVVLHAEAGDDGSWLEKHIAKDGSNVLTGEAERRGYIVASPLARGPFSAYQGSAEKDVFDLIDVLERTYEVDEKQVFLLGHSMGGAAVMTLAMARPGRFAGLANVAGVPSQAVDYARAPDVPVLFVEGGKDTFLPPDAARRHAYQLQRRIKRLEYLALAGEDHMSVATASLPQIFDYFDHVRAGAWKPSGKPVPLPSSSR